MLLTPDGVGDQQGSPRGVPKLCPVALWSEPKRRVAPLPSVAADLDQHLARKLGRQ